MRKRRAVVSAISVASFLASASVTALPVAYAATGTTIYVDNSASAGCSDTAAGAGSSATPFCTVQAALGIVQPGDTILAGGAQAPFTVTASGTAAAPISIESMGTPFQTDTSVRAVNTADPAITISGAAYVNLSGFDVVGDAGPAVLVTGANHIALDSDEFSGTSTPNATAIVHVTGGSSYVTLSRDYGTAYGTGGLIAVDGGGTGDVITTDYLAQSSRGPAIAVDDASNMAITSNTVRYACGAGIQVTGGSTATLENNVASQLLSSGNSRQCTAAPAASHEILVDASSAAGTTADYNLVDATSLVVGALAYSWAGTSYASAADLTKATGQGAHDINSLMFPNPATMSGSAPAQIDAANADAPGELATDYLGHARVDDPIVPNKGVGVRTYFDRGAVETVATPGALSVLLSTPTYVVTTAPVGGSVTVEGDVTDPWDAAVTCTIDFGDGTSTTAVATGNSSGTCRAPHQYAKTGVYEPTVTVRFSSGATDFNKSLITIDAPAPVVPSLRLTPTASLAVSPSCSATSGWNMDTFEVDYGDGTTLPCIAPHTYLRPGTYTVTMTATDAGGNSAKTSTSFTTAGDWYTPLTPSRILDTRNGTGTGSAAKVPGYGVLRLKVAGAGGIPASGVDAVALNVTVTNPTTGGYVTAYPDGAARPATSNLNFAAGQTVPNTVIVKVGADGYVDLLNGSSGTTNLVADVQGYYSVNSANGYITLTPTRVLDTRAGKATIPPGGTVRVNFGAYANAAVALNVTVANAKAPGYITAYPDNTPIPKTSNVNFAAGQIIQNEAIAKVGADDYVDFTNTSAGSTDLIIDLTGAFDVEEGLGFVPITPSRLLDTRPSHGGSGPVPAGAALPVPVTADAAISPGKPQAIAANITVTDPTSNGYVSIYPDDVTGPLTSVLNFGPGQTIPNATSIGVGPTKGGDVLYNGSAGTVQLIADVFGFYN